MNVCRIVEAYSYWTFSDIFDENYMPSRPFQGGFGLLSIEGVPKPAYRAFELLHRLGTDELPVAGTHDTARAWSVRRDNTVTVLLTNHALPRHSVTTELVHVSLGSAPAPRMAYIERVDDDHANAKRAWCEMGEPEYPSRIHMHEMEIASLMTRDPIALSYNDRTIAFDVGLPPHGVAAVTIEF
jgi:xylan 1,4-beta-xylosidase